MQTVADRHEAPSTIRTDLGAIFVSLELSRSRWLITSLSPDGGEKMSKHAVRGGDVAEPLDREPLGRPFGLPDWPGVYKRPSLVMDVF